MSDFPPPSPDNTETRSAVGPVRFDQENGLGQTPNNANVNYRGFVAMMRPSKYLALAHPVGAGEHQGAVDHIKSAIRGGKPLGSPFFNVDFGDKFGKVMSHDGRHRMMAIQQTLGDEPVPVHIMGYGEDRARHLTPDDIHRMRDAMISQRGEPSTDNFGDAFHQKKLVLSRAAKADGGEVVSMPGSATPETRKLNTFHKNLMGDVRERARAAMAQAQAYHEDGRLPMPVGTRFHTAHSKANGLPPWTVTHHYVDDRDPEHYGYGVTRGTPDVDRETSRLSVSNPAAEARMAKMGRPIDYKALAAQFEPITGPRAVKASGGKVNGVPIHKNPPRARLEALTRRTPEGYMRGLRHDDDHYWWDGSKAIHKDGADAIGIPYDYRDRLEAMVHGAPSSRDTDPFRLGSDVHGLPPSLRPPSRGPSDDELLDQLGVRPRRADGGALMAQDQPPVDYRPRLLAAIKHGGKTYTGKYHRDAYAALPSDAARREVGTDGRQFGFVDEGGRYLGRVAAMQYARDFGLLHPRYENTSSPHLISEMLRSNGGRAHKAEGGAMATEGAGPFQPKLHVGPIHSAVAGRTDHLPMHVPSGAYVIPADIVSAHGEGSTMAGFKVLRRMFGGTPYGAGKQPYGHSGGPYGKGDGPYDQGGGPYGEPLPGKASGGATDGSVPIVAAGGEYVLSPQQVKIAGEGDLDLGHRVLDEFVKRTRNELIKTLEKLPGPKRD